jgi:hypothetical protein
MHHQPVRQTFGQRNAKSPAPAPPPGKPSSRSAKGGGLSVHPMILAGGTAFILAVAAVMMLGGAPPVQPGRAPQITELPGGSQTIKPASPAQGTQTGNTGKLGAANSAVGGLNR